MRLLTILLISMMLLAAPVAMAKGGSSGYVSSEPSYESKVSKVQSMCEQKTRMRDRIACRLNNPPEIKGIPEPCRVLESKDSCIAFYERVFPCYKESGIDKDYCFKKNSGFKVKGTLNEKSQKAIRFHLVALLYDIEEYIEDAHVEGDVSTSDAADLITRIQDIKISVLDKEPKKGIADQISVFKAKYSLVFE
jgi:hypothetical protein